MPKLLIDPVEFHYELIGEEGTQIVFISGYNCDIDLWRPVAEALSKEGYKTLIFSNQSIGETRDDTSLPLTCQSMARNTQKLILALAINSRSKTSSSRIEKI